MGRRGPAPKPTPLRERDGGAGHRPLNTHEPKPVGEPEPPAWLSEQGREIWDQLVPRLYITGLARSIDAGALGRYCETFVKWIKTNEFLNKNGSMYPVRGEPKGKKPGRILSWREFPAAGEYRKLSQQLLALEREFGQTPSARCRIRLENEGAAAKDTSELKRRMFGPPVIGRVGKAGA